MKDFAEFLKVPFYRFFVDFPLGIAGIIVIYLFINHHNNTLLADLEKFLYRYNMKTTLEGIPTFIYIGFSVMIVFVGELIASVGEFYVGLFFRGYPRINKEKKYLIEQVTISDSRWENIMLLFTPYLWFLISYFLSIFFPICMFLYSGLIAIAILFLGYSIYSLYYENNYNDSNTLLAQDFVKAFAKDNTVLQLSEVSFVLSRLFSGFYIIIIFTAPYISKIDAGYIIVFSLAIITLCLAIYSRSFGNALLKEKASMMSTYIR